MNKNKETCGAPRAIDDAKIRTEAVFIEAESHVLYQRVQGLHKRLEDLKPELPYADPIKDRELDLFLLELSRSVIALQSLADLRETARSMQKFGLPVAPVAVLDEASDCIAIKPGEPIPAGLF